jgi:Uma2 family endonuclease
MGETDAHINLLIYLREALYDHFRDDLDIYIAGNLFVYYEEGDPTGVIAPDIFVVKGVPKRDRRIYQVWKEGKGLDVVFEITSESTRKKDLGSKKGTYEMLGVKEYYIFDPFGEYLQPRLVGFRLGTWGYQRIEEKPLVSRVLGLELRVEGNMLRLVDPRTGDKLLSPREAQESYRLEAEARRRAEAEVERLRAELARLREE